MSYLWALCVTRHRHGQVSHFRFIPFHARSLWMLGTRQLVMMRHDRASFFHSAPFPCTNPKQACSQTENTSSMTRLEFRATVWPLVNLSTCPGLPSPRTTAIPVTSHTPGWRKSDARVSDAGLRSWSRWSMQWRLQCVSPPQGPT
jgi:hypothetical protein